MKIKDVCKKTGLTERTVRFYVGQGLLTPVSAPVNNRVYLDFTEENIGELETLAALRRARFSISEIVLMKREPQRIPELSALLGAELRERAAESGELAEALAGADYAQIRDIAGLARALDTFRPPEEPLARALEPRFGRFDRETAAEKEEAYRSFLVHSARRKKRRTLLGAACGAVFLAAASVFITLLASGVLPAKKASEPEPPAEAYLEDRMTEEEVLSLSSDFRALAAEPREGFAFATAGFDVVSGNLVVLYSDGERSFTLTCDQLDVMECAAVEELGLPLLFMNTDPDTAKQRVEILVPGKDEGEYWGVWLESGDITEAEMIAVCGSGGVLVLSPWSGRLTVTG